MKSRVPNGTRNASYINSILNNTMLLIQNENCGILYRNLPIVIYHPPPLSFDPIATSAPHLRLSKIPLSGISSQTF